MNNICECAERDCHAHYGRSACGNVANVTLYRNDQSREPGKFCPDCASEARASGEWIEAGIETKLIARLMLKN
jgi:hypothetical protein